MAKRKNFRGFLPFTGLLKVGTKSAMGWGTTGCLDTGQYVWPERANKMSEQAGEPATRKQEVTE
jgi:hypothetical protein